MADVKITGITTTEEVVMNPEFKGWREARIEAFFEGQKGPHPFQVGRIRVFKNDELFVALTDAICGRFYEPIEKAPTMKEVEVWNEEQVSGAVGCDMSEGELAYMEWEADFINRD